MFKEIEKEFNEIKPKYERFKNKLIKTLEDVSQQVIDLFESYKDYLNEDTKKTLAIRLYNGSCSAMGNHTSHKVIDGKVFHVSFAHTENRLFYSHEKSISDYINDLTHSELKGVIKELKKQNFKKMIKEKRSHYELIKKNNLREGLYIKIKDDSIFEDAKCRCYEISDRESGKLLWQVYDFWDIIKVKGSNSVISFFDVPLNDWIRKVLGSRILGGHGWGYSTLSKLFKELGQDLSSKFIDANQPR